MDQSKSFKENLDSYIEGGFAKAPKMVKREFKKAFLAGAATALHSLDKETKEKLLELVTKELFIVVMEDLTSGKVEEQELRDILDEAKDDTKEPKVDAVLRA